MDAFFQQIFNILIVPPGNLVYHLVLTFSVAAALQAALAHWYRSGLLHSRRMVTGLGLLLAIRIILIFGAGLAWQNLVNAHFLPPIERALTLLSLILIAWLWAFPERNRSADSAAILLALLTFTLLAFGLVWWSAQSADLPYNGSWPDQVGELVSLAILLAGILAVILRRPDGWGFGLAMLCVMAAGHLGHLLFIPSTGDFSGAVRLAELIAYPLLLYLPQRLPLAALEPPASKQSSIQERRQYGADRQLVRAFLSLATTPAGQNNGQACRDITCAVAHTLLADMCLLVSPPNESSEIIIECGYDLIREEKLSGASLDSRAAPVIESALRRGRLLHLPASSTSPDLVSLSRVLHLKRAGHLLAAPVLGEGEAALSALILLSPYSNRAWTSEDESYLAEIAKSLAQLLHHPQQISTFQGNHGSSWNEAEKDDLLHQLASLQEQVEKDRVQIESLSALIQHQEEARQLSENLDPDRIGQPSESNQLVQAARAEVIEGELVLALEEIARLKAALSDADPEYQLGSSPFRVEQNEAVISLAQDLRQPMISIISYADFLLADTNDILTTNQRKSLERIKLSAERMSRLVDDLIQVSSQNGLTGSVEEVDPLNVITDALERTEEQRRQKRQSVQINLPERLPLIKVDRESFKQVLVKLFQNSSAATPPDQNLTLTGLLERPGDAREYMLLQVGDHGGGIFPEDLPRVFSRLRQDSDSPISGVGLSSIELSDAKTMVEAMEGRLWVDTNPGSGSTFSILFPAAALSGTLSPDNSGGMEG